MPPDSRRVDACRRLPRGLVAFGGTPFELRGVVQLAAQASRLRRATFPAAIRGLRLPPRCRRLHFLHAVDGELDSGALAGRAVIHFESGPAEILPFRYGQEFGAVISSDRSVPASPHSAVAWSLDVPGSLRHLTLYRTTWENPRLEEQTAMLDYESALARQGPCLFAVTVDP